MLRTYVLLTASILAGLPACAQRTLDPHQVFSEQLAERDLRHQTPEWFSIEPHLPNPTTGSAADLTTAADVLRARRMPEDALEYYGYALKRGGEESNLLKRMGITELEMHNNRQAEADFRRAIQLKAKDADSWNNLGAVQSVNGEYRASVASYKRALKFNKKLAVTHSNLGTAYFELKDFESAHHEFEQALALNPHIFDTTGSGGVQAHLLSPQDRGRFCFEMARLAATHGDDEAVLHWLAQASEAGLNIQDEMSGDARFAPYRKDTRVALLIANARAMRSRQLASASPAPPLPPEEPRQK